MSDHPGWLVVGSTAAGSSGEQEIEVVAGALARHAPVEVAVTGDEAEVDAALGAGGDRTLVVVGGDGSAHVVVNALDRLDRLGSTTVGFVPLGTANDFATHLGMSATPRQAAAQLVAGRPRALDLLRLTADDPAAGQLVVNALHAGLGVDGARRARPLKPVLGPLAYPLGVAATGVVSRGVDVTVTVDGEPVGDGGPVLAVAIANAPRLGGVELVAGAEPDDGLLDVLVVPARPWRARVGSIVQAAGRPSSALAATRGRTVVVSGALGEVDADGEIVETGAACRVELLPGALHALGAP